MLADVRLSPARRALWGAVAVVLAVALCGGTLFAIDVYLHHRVQNTGGVNVWGYRGPTVGPKQPGEVRVVVLGGSTAFGYGLPYNESFAFYLEQLLNDRASPPRRFTVVNLGAPNQGAYGFLFDLEDYAYLGYDAAIFYEGYNDLGTTDLPSAVPARAEANHFLFRRQSPVFRWTGYMPVLPLVFREKAMSLRAGGQLDAAYRGRATFQPGLATRATASALETAATVADAVGRQLGALSADISAVEHKPVDVDTWRPYTDSVVRAVAYARAHHVKALVVTQPYGSDSHVAQQRALASALTATFGADPGVRYVNLGRLLNIRDPQVAYDGLHLVAPANRRVAEALVGSVEATLQ